MIFYVKKISAFVITLISSAAVCITANAYDTGSVTADILNVRNGAGTNHSVIGQLANGQAVQIKEYTNNGWLKITYNNKDGYVSAQYISVRSNETTSRSGSHSQRDEKNTVVVTDNLNFRFSPSLDGGIITVIPKGTTIEMKKDLGNEWAEVLFNNITGYVSLQYISHDLNYSVSNGQAVCDFALKYVGKPYRYGGNGPDAFDCSGFTNYVFSNFGISLNRIAKDQAYNGTFVSRDNLMPGDLVLFYNSAGTYIDHAGIYIGNNQFIHASSSGSCVKISDFTGYFSNKFHSARRIVN